MYALQLNEEGHRQVHSNRSILFTSYVDVMFNSWNTGKQNVLIKKPINKTPKDTYKYCIPNEYTSVGNPTNVMPLMKLHQYVDSKRIYEQKIQQSTKTSFHSLSPGNQRKCNWYNGHIPSSDQIFVFGFLFFLEKSKINSNHNAYHQHHNETAIIQPRKLLQLSFKHIINIRHFDWNQLLRQPLQKFEH